MDILDPLDILDSLDGKTHSHILLSSMSRSIVWASATIIPKFLVLSNVFKIKLFMR
jgi:hypothetical protein